MSLLQMPQPYSTAASAAITRRAGRAQRLSIVTPFSLAVVALCRLCVAYEPSVKFANDAAIAGAPELFRPDLTNVPTMAGRFLIEDVSPSVMCGRYPAKAVVGELVPVSARAYREGHDS